MLLSTVILTKNSQATVLKALKSVLFSDEIIIVDDFSDDQTLKIVKNFKHPHLKILQRKLANDFSAQRNFAIASIKAQWILFLDADEEVSLKLKAEILQCIKNTTFSAFYLKRNDLFLGKLLKYGETANIKLLRLAKKGAGKWSGKVHEVWQVNDKVSTLKNPLTHARTLTISQLLDKINWYTDIRARELITNNTQEYWWQIFAYPKLKFIQNYFLRLGKLDGFRGFIFAYLMSWHSFLVRIKVVIYKLKK